MTLTAQDREQIESELDLMRTHRANLAWNACVSVDARARRDESVVRADSLIRELELMLDKG